MHRLNLLRKEYSSAAINFHGPYSCCWVVLFCVVVLCYDPKSLVYTSTSLKSIPCLMS